MNNNPWDLYESVKGVGLATATINRKVEKAAEIVKTRMEGLTGRYDTETLARAIVEAVAEKEIYPTLCKLSNYGATDGEPMSAVIHHLMRPYRRQTQTSRSLYY